MVNFVLNYRHYPEKEQEAPGIWKKGTAEEVLNIVLKGDVVSRKQGWSGGRPEVLSQNDSKQRNCAKPLKGIWKGYSGWSREFLQYSTLDDPMHWSWYWWKRKEWNWTECWASGVMWLYDISVPDIVPKLLSIFTLLSGCGRMEEKNKKGHNKEGRI